MVKIERRALEVIEKMLNEIPRVAFSSGASVLDETKKITNPIPSTQQLRVEYYFTILTLLTTIYGTNSNHLKDFTKRHEAFSSGSHVSWYFTLYLGILNSLKANLEAGLIGNLETEIRGELLGDFITMASQAYDDNHKDVAVVLACAALEDALKKIATLNGMQADGKDLSAVSNYLKSQGVIKGAQSSLMSGFVTLRNKAFHAQWDKIEKAEVAGLIAFTKELLIKHF